MNNARPEKMGDAIREVKVSVKLHSHCGTCG